MQTQTTRMAIVPPQSKPPCPGRYMAWPKYLALGEGFSTGKKVATTGVFRVARV